jgi:hypothetical protein
VSREGVLERVLIKMEINMFGLSEISWSDFLIVNVVVCVCVNIVMSVCVCFLFGDKDSINKVRKKKSLSEVKTEEK